MKRGGLLLWLLLLCCIAAKADERAWARTGTPLTYYVQPHAAPVVTTAMEMLCGDLQAVTATRPMACDRERDALLCVVTLDPSHAQRRLLTRYGLYVENIRGRWEAFSIQVKVTGGKYRLFVVGSDARGTAYGLMELSRLAGVSPWCWWADVTPQPQTALFLPCNYNKVEAPSVQYRGIFLNDEDFGLMPWSSTTYEPLGVRGEIGPKTYSRIFELLLRLRANTIWPAMHPCTVPFYRVAGAKEAAARYGIVVGTSHCEPLLRNNAAEWDAQRYGEYNYKTNRDTILAYWRERVMEAAPYENIYTVGMRGVHDSGLVGVTTLDEKKQLVEQAIADQRGLLKECTGRKIETLPQLFIPYKEVEELLDSGLTVPDDVTLMWCDDNYGYLGRGASPEQQRRRGGGGVYYHLSYWGRPHDYLWLSTTQPGLVYSEMHRAWDNGARRIWIANVGDIKPAEYDLELFLDMAWNINGITPLTIYHHMQQWLQREFGDQNAAPLLGVMKQYYRLAAIRKPEFMGWNETEIGGYSDSASPIHDTAFNPGEFGDEIADRLDEYAAIKEVVLEVKKKIPASRRDAYFELMEYPVCAAEALNRKILYAQLARSMAARGLSTAWDMAQKSREAYNDILSLTHYYNEEVAGGKWRGIMSMNPRNLQVFAPPLLPQTLSGDSAATAPVAVPASKPDPGYVAVNGFKCSYNSPGSYFVQGLGHSMSALRIPAGGMALYEIETPATGEALMRVALIPIHPLGGGAQRYAVSIDGEEPQIVSVKTSGRSSEWKRNVLRAQSLHTTRHLISRAGKHQIVIKALDDELFIDQWMLDFNTQRQFYVFPMCIDCM